MNILFAAGSPSIGSPYSWVSFWTKWPAGMEDPDTHRVEPSDETLVRSLLKTQLSFAAADMIPYTAGFGLIAFDGGDFPEFYENGSFVSNVSLVAPPNPLVDGDDDWIIRQPYFNVSETGLAFTPPSLETAPWTESRAMRKLPPNMGILAVLGIVNFTSTAAAIAMHWALDCRHAIRSGYTA